jgi:hypothetical protein
VGHQGQERHGVPRFLDHRCGRRQGRVSSRPSSTAFVFEVCEVVMTQRTQDVSTAAELWEEHI